MSTDQDNLDALQVHEEALDRCFAKLSHSPNARAMINEAVREGWQITLDDQGPYDFHIDVKDKTIVLNNEGLAEGSLARSDHFQSMLLVSLVRALRDVWQEKRYGAFHDDYSPEQVLMLERVRAADCDVMAVLVAWELRAEGSSGMWRYMIGSEEGDMAMIFSGHLERKPYSTSLNEALLAAFNQWYRSEERVKACDHETLDYMDSLMEENLEYDVFGSERLTPGRVEILSCLPDKTAYLQGTGREIMLDPFYSGLDDVINQAHFAQILHDLKVTFVQGVPFRDKDLAYKIFPNGFMSDDNA